MSGSQSDPRHVTRPHLSSSGRDDEEVVKLCHVRLDVAHQGLLTGATADRVERLLHHEPCDVGDDVAHQTTAQAGSRAP